MMSDISKRLTLQRPSQWDVRKALMWVMVRTNLWFVHVRLYMWKAVRTASCSSAWDAGIVWLNLTVDNPRMIKIECSLLNRGRTWSLQTQWMRLGLFYCDWVSLSFGPMTGQKCYRHGPWGFLDMLLICWKGEKLVSGNKWPREHAH